MNRFLAYICVAMITVGICIPCVAQANPNLESGIRPFGSYQGGNVDSIDLTNGNVGFSAPLFSYPQRGKLKLAFNLASASKNWSANSSNGGYAWGTTSSLRNAGGVILGYSLNMQLTGIEIDGGANPAYSSLSLATPDGSSHVLAQTVSGSNSNWETTDTSGYAL